MKTKTEIEVKQNFRVRYGSAVRGRAISEYEMHGTLKACETFANKLRGMTKLRATIMDVEERVGGHHWDLRARWVRKTRNAKWRQV